MNPKTRKLTLIGMFSALAYVFTLVGHLVPISFTDFLKYDPKDIIIVIAGFSLGPVSALIISVVVALLELVTISQTGIIGCVMNIISSVAFACIASLFYKKFKTMGGAIAGLILASLATTALMLLWNYIVTPIYMKIPREAIVSMLLPIFLPFNLIKAFLNSAIVMLIYKPVVKALRGAGLIRSEKTEEKGQGSIKIGVALASLFVIALMIALFILLKQ